MIPGVILAIILVLGVGFLGPREERLAEQATRMDPHQYPRAFGAVKLVTWVLVVLVVAATFLMTAYIPA